MGGHKFAVVLVAQAQVLLMTGTRWAPEALGVAPERFVGIASGWTICASTGPLAASDGC
jgi:hypothetical protein